ncbi:MAG: TIGR02466 family protein [Pseudomonadota bacterium]|nr:TIGR02466 family protein [Pseudomonadota bacterium]
MVDDLVPDFDIRKSLFMYFATHVVAHDWPDSDAHNAELQALILGKEAEESQNQVVRSNAGGWQSSGNLIQWQEPCIDVFRRRIEKLVSSLLQELIRDTGQDRSFQLMIDSWANVNRNNDYNVVHTHPNCMFSGVYYVTRGNPDPDVPHGGLLEILDPREAANYVQVAGTVLDARTFFENPPGRMLLWPSWVKHMVHPYVGDGERISIAFNVNVLEQS